MADYKSIREQFKKDRAISASVLDNFLIYYAAHKNKLDKEYEERVSRFSTALNNLPVELAGMLKSQYIAHRIFKEGGLIGKYLNHEAIRDLDEEQQNYLRKVAERPWRFSFSAIMDSPADGFYEMEDVFTGEDYLLYSGAVTRTLSEQPILLWLNLIVFNGKCWETYGPVTGFQSFEAEDIFFYSSILTTTLESEADLMEDLEENPVPYMMLVSSANYPLVRDADHEIVQVVGQQSCSLSEISALKNDFKVEYSQGIYKISHAEWSVAPHFAEAYYDEDNGQIFLTALTDQGYFEMANSLNEYPVNIPDEPDIRVHLPMIITIQNLIDKDFEFFKFNRFFEPAASSENDPLTGRLNELLELAIPYLNAGKEPDIDAMARQVGINPELARELLQHTMERYKEIRK